MCLLLDRSVSVWFLGIVDVDKYFLKQSFITIISRRFKFSLLEAAAMLKIVNYFLNTMPDQKKSGAETGWGLVAQVHNNVISDEVRHKMVSKGTIKKSVGVRAQSSFFKADYLTDKSCKIYIYI